MGPQSLPEDLQLDVLAMGNLIEIYSRPAAAEAADLDEIALDELERGLVYSEASEYSPEVPRNREDRLAWARLSLINFMKAYLPQYLTAPFAPFHHELAKISLDVALCQGDYVDHRGFVAAAPRGHSKSTFVSLALILYCICFQEKKFIVIFSDSDIPQAKMIAANIKAELEENDLIRRDFGEMNGELYGRHWSEQDFTACHTENGRVIASTRVLSRGVGSKVRGLRQRQNRPDLVVLDDCENDKNCASEAMRQKLDDWFAKVVKPMLDRRVGRVLMVGTIIHPDSLLSRLLKRCEDESPEFIGRKWKALQEDNTPLWPEVWSLTALLAEKRRNPFAFSTEYQNDPLDEETRRVRPEWLGWYSRHDVTYRREDRTLWYQGKQLRVYGFIDPAISEQELADQFAAIILGVTQDRKKILVLDSYAARIDFAAQVTKAITFANSYNVRRMGIEANAYQKALPDVVRKRLHDNRVRPLKRYLRKFDRITGVSPIFAEGMVLFREAVDGEAGEIDELGLHTVHHTLVPFYRQLVRWPSTAHDDLVDAFEGGVQMAGGMDAFFQDQLTPAV